MNFKVTYTGKPRVIRGGQFLPVNTTADGCAATINTRYGAICCTNIVSMAFYPMTAVLYEYDL